MSKLRILVSLTTNDNDYQIEQAESAENSARKLNVDLQIVYADNDAINQSTQILKAVQAPPAVRPHAVDECALEVFNRPLSEACLRI